MIPTGIDAPLYHRPLATVGLILANTTAFIVFNVTGSVDVTWEGWSLIYGDGLHPLQWLTFSFAHHGIGQLVGNMLFLLIFGMVVEGKVGSLRFLAIYPGIAVTGGAALQICGLAFADSVTGASGASLAVFGLLAICILWAPENEVTMGMSLYWGVGWFEFDCRIWVLGLWYLAFELLGISVLDESIGNLVGAAIGFAIGYRMLVQNYVDCEDWDLLSIRKNGRPSTNFVRPTAERVAQLATPVSTRKKTAANDVSSANLPAALMQAIRNHQLSSAADVYKHFTSHRPEPHSGLRKYEADLYRLLIKSKQFAKAARCLETFLTRYPNDSTRQQLCLATIFIEHLERPKAGLRVLDTVDCDALDEKRQVLVNKLERKAYRLIDDGVLEVVSHDHVR